jgi:hypothetical protein
MVGVLGVEIILNNHQGRKYSREKKQRQSQE